RQQLTITPQLQQALRLLQPSSQEFTQEVEQALTSNPFLEEDTEPPAPDATGMPAAAGAAGAAGPDPGETNTAPAEDPWPAHPPAQAMLTTGPGSGDGERDWTEWTEAPTSLRDSLRSQVMLSPMGDRDRTLVHL